MDSKLLVGVMASAILALVGWNIKTTNELQLSVQKLEIILLSDAFENWGLHGWTRKNISGRLEGMASVHDDRFYYHVVEGGWMVHEPTRSYDTTVSVSIRRDGGCHRGIRDLDGKRGIRCLVQ